MIYLGIAFAVGVILAIFMVAFVRWGSRWGATAEEQVDEMPGDAFLRGGPEARVAMTRAITLRASPEETWPWLAQFGRGAGFYSYDRLDNGGKTSARHIVCWIPDPALGDASPIGYLARLEPGRSLTWWMKGLRFLGTFVRMTVDVSLAPAGQGARLVIRMSGDAEGLVARPVLWFFMFIDSIMARRQLLVIRERVERFGAREVDPDQPEDGSRSQYQFYEAIYASGERVGVPGKEKASQWREAAVEDGVLDLPG